MEAGSLAVHVLVGVDAVVTALLETETDPCLLHRSICFFVVGLEFGRRCLIAIDSV